MTRSNQHSAHDGLDYNQQIMSSSALASMAVAMPHQNENDTRSSSLPRAEKTTTGTTFATDYSDEPNWPKDPKAYLCLLGCFFLMFNSWGLVNAYGTYQSYYKQHLFSGRDLLLLNLIGSTESFVVLTLSFVIGRLLDAGFYRYLTGTGTVLVTIGMFTLGVANPQSAQDINQPATRNQGNYMLTWLTQGLTLGLGMACFFVSSSQIVATYFVKRKSFAVGIVASGASISGMVYPMMTKYLLASIGFRNAVFSVAGVVLATSITSFLLAVPNPEFKPRKPEKWMSKRVWVDTQARHNAAYMWFVASIAIMFFGFYCVFFNLEEWAAYSGFGYKDVSPAGDMITYSAEAGVPELQKDALRTFYLLSIMNGCSTVGRLGAAYLSDHYGALNIHAIVSAVASLLCLLLWTLASNVPSAIAFVVLFGAFSGAVIGLPPASVAYILGPDREAQRRLGQWTGMMYTVAAPFALTGPVIAGHLITQYNQDYRTVQLWAGGCLAVSAFCQAMAIYKRRSSQEQQATRMGRRLSRWASTANESIMSYVFRRNGSKDDSSRKNSEDDIEKAMSVSTPGQGGSQTNTQPASQLPSYVPSYAASQVDVHDHAAGTVSRDWSSRVADRLK